MTEQLFQSPKTRELRKVQVLVLGGGPGGYSCAIRAAQLGLDVLLVEPKRAGGTCLHAGCIPSKALIHASQRYRESTASVAAGARNGKSQRAHGLLAEMGIGCAEVTLNWSQTQAWKNAIVDKLAHGIDGLLARAGVQVLRGRGEMLDGKRARVLPDTPAGGEGAAEVEVHAQYVVLAVGGREIRLPALPASESVLYARDVLSLSELPRHLAVVGGGYIGLELGQAFARLGVAVTIVEAQDRLLPAYPQSLVAPLVKTLTDDGLRILTSTVAQDWEDGFLSVSSVGDGVGAKAGNSEGAVQRVPADKVLVAVGRCANLDGWGRDQLALDLVDGFIAVDSHGETSMTGVYAVGDLTGEPMLAHRAIAQGHVVAQCLAGQRRQFSPVAVPAICFTSPEIISVGLTGEGARAAGLNVSVTRFPLAANGRSLTLGAQGSSAGFIEVVADSADHALLGVQAVGEHVAELVNGFTLALEMGARLEDIADTIHAHPTIGESFAEVSMAALGLGAH